MNVGDSVRWKVTPAAQGAGEAVITHVLIKPTDAGLITNLVITTNKRTYIVKLVSRGKKTGCRRRLRLSRRRDRPMASLSRQPR